LEQCGVGEAAPHEGSIEPITDRTALSSPGKDRKIVSLTYAVSFWDSLSVVLAVAVFLGVAGESVADFETLARWTRLNTRPRLRTGIAKASLLVLIAALAFEVVAAVGSRRANEHVIGALNRELDTTIRHSTALTALTRELGLSNVSIKRKLGEQQSLIADMEKQSNAFVRAIRAQQSRDDAVLVDLQREESQLRAAKDDALASAGIAASAATTANKAAADMSATLDAERSMRDQMNALVTPRRLTVAQAERIIDALKIYPNTPFDICVANDPDSFDLSSQIVTVLEQAGWAWRPAPSIGSLVRTLPDKPTMCILTIQGLRIEVAEEKRSSLGQPMAALADGLIAAGIRVGSSFVPNGGMAKSKFDQTSLHIFVGSK
jgi:hypothetical protein